MTDDKHKNLVREYYEVVFNQRHLDMLARFLSPSFISRGPSGIAEDRAAHQRSLEASLAAFPDLHLAVEEQVAEGDTVVTRWTAQATHRGILFDLQPTNKEVKACAVHFHPLADGRIVEQWKLLDLAGLLRQLGAS